jgi:hypothetical protein
MIASDGHDIRPAVSRDMFRATVMFRVARGGTARRAYSGAHLARETEEIPPDLSRHIAIRDLGLAS